MTVKSPRRQFLHLAAGAAALPAVSRIARAQNVMTAEPQFMDRHVTVNGLRLHYLEWGTAAKPPMILIHGIARHAHTFDHIVPEFTRDYRVIALDMRGH